jgi:hypothetical protein
VIIERIEVDSRVFGRNVLAILDFDPAANFSACEREYIDEFDPAYVSSKVPLDRVSDIHALERSGFNFIECQIRAAMKLRKPYDVSQFPYDFDQVTREEDLQHVLQIAGSTFLHDRFRVDPSVASQISGARYREYVRKSFHSPDEAVYCLRERASGRVVAFKTHRYVGSTEVLFLLGGVHPELKNAGLGLISEYFEFNTLIGKGIRRGITHISASNHSIFNLEIGRVGFRVLGTFAVMRKVYPTGVATLGTATQRK